MIGLSANISQLAASWWFGAIALIATAILMVIMSSNSVYHGTSINNFGLQQAWTAEKATAIVKAWKDIGCSKQAANQVWLDYLFILAYASFLFFIGLRSERAAAAHGMSSLAFFAGLSSWGGLVAGVFDGLENVGLLIMILQEPSSIVARVTSVCSTLKWALIANSLLTGLTVAVAVWIYRP